MKKGNILDLGCALDRDIVYEKFLQSYSVYYNVTRIEDMQDAFDAEAFFLSKGEQYFLIKAAKVAEMHTAEYVYFAREDELTARLLGRLDEEAWTRGMSKVKPSSVHKNTDVVLVIIAERITEDAADMAATLKHSKNYKLGLFGYSNYRLVAVGCSEGRVYFNNQAKILKELVGNIISDEKEKGK